MIAIPAFLQNLLDLHLTDSCGRIPRPSCSPTPEGASPALELPTLDVAASAHRRAPSQEPPHPRPPAYLRRTADRSGSPPQGHPDPLGHSSIQVALDLYGHLFPDEMDRLAEHLDAAHGAATMQIAASVRMRAARGHPFPSGERNRPSDEELSSWGGEDLNLRPTDYEFDPGRSVTCAIRAELPSEQGLLSSKETDVSHGFAVHRGANAGAHQAHLPLHKMLGRQGLPPIAGQEGTSEPPQPIPQL
jgi:hypothetical protein